MKTTILQEKLVKALQQANRTISTKSQIPILQNILLRVEKTDITAVATNMESTVLIALSGKAEKEGSLCVPAKIFYDLVNTLPPGPVLLESDGDTLLVSCSSTKAEIPCVLAAEYPEPPEVVKKNPREEDAKEIAATIRSVLFCAATDDSRPVLTGIYIETKEDETVFAATDGYRLTVKNNKKIPSFENKMLISAAALGEVVRSIEENKKITAVGVFSTADGQPAFIVGDTTIITRKIEGDYPAFEKIIPKNHTTTAVVNQELFESAVKSAAIFARDSANIVRLHTDAGGIDVSANTPSVGKNTIHIDAKTEGDSGDIAFNSRFLLDYLSNSSREGDVVFEMTGSLNPGVFRSLGDETRVHIIMPVRVQA